MVCGRGGGRDLARACLRWDRTEAGLWTVQHQAQLLLLFGLWVAMVKGGLQNGEELVGDWGKLNLKKRCEMLHLKSGVKVSLMPGGGPLWSHGSVCSWKSGLPLPLYSCSK